MCKLVEEGHYFPGSGVEAVAVPAVLHATSTSFPGSCLHPTPLRQVPDCNKCIVPAGTTLTALPHDSATVMGGTMGSPV